MNLQFHKLQNEFIGFLYFNILLMYNMQLWWFLWLVAHICTPLWPNEAQLLALFWLHVKTFHLTSARVENTGEPIKATTIVHDLFCTVKTADGVVEV